jgi:CheY-like chemotaxis protein
MAKILIVEDDIDTRQMYTLLLKASGYTPEKGYTLMYASDGTQAVTRAVPGSGIDLILMDILMPNMDGYAAAQQIRQQIDIPIIATTAQNISRVQLRVAGMDPPPFTDYLQRPHGRQELADMVSKYLPKA